MKKSVWTNIKLLWAIVLGVVIGVFGFSVLPATAQINLNPIGIVKDIGSSVTGVAPTQWVVTTTPFSGSATRVAFTKHNTKTGQTLIATCEGICDEEEERTWYEFPVDGK